jgi:plasmid stabilization system protein ParE
VTFQVTRSPRAAAEIRAIAEYLAEHSGAAARRFLEALMKAREQLATFPNSGAAGIIPGTRRLVVGDYIISYRRRADVVEVFAVRHARRKDARP